MTNSIFLRRQGYDTTSTHGVVPRRVLVNETPDGGGTPRRFLSRSNGEEVPWGGVRVWRRVDILREKENTEQRSLFVGEIEGETLWVVGKLLKSVIFSAFLCNCRRRRQKVGLFQVFRFFPIPYWFHTLYPLPFYPPPVCEIKIVL